jgi:hypothetical protein
MYMFGSHASFIFIVLMIAMKFVIFTVPMIAMKVIVQCDGFQHVLINYAK